MSSAGGTCRDGDSGVTVTNEDVGQPLADSLKNATGLLLQTWATGRPCYLDALAQSVVEGLEQSQHALSVLEKLGEPAPGTPSQGAVEGSNMKFSSSLVDQEYHPGPEPSYVGTIAEQGMLVFAPLKLGQYVWAVLYPRTAPLTTPAIIDMYNTLGRGPPGWDGRTSIYAWFRCERGEHRHSITVGRRIQAAIFIAQLPTGSTPRRTTRRSGPRRSSAIAEVAEAVRNPVYASAVSRSAC